MVKNKGWKPIINTNGVPLTMDLLKELKKAGVSGFTFHIDSQQGRPGWKDKNEPEHNELRLKYAEMLAEVGGLSCSFNATIYPETIQYVPELLKWGQEHIDKVHVMVFILYRMAIIGKDFDFYAGKEQVHFDDMMYSKNDDERRTDISSPELVDIIRKEYPDFMPSAFLNGTHDPDSYKWLLTSRLGNKHEIFGYGGPKFMELVQTWKHLTTDSYLAYSTARFVKKRKALFPFGPFRQRLKAGGKKLFQSFFQKSESIFQTCTPSVRNDYSAC